MIFLVEFLKGLDSWSNLKHKKKFVKKYWLGRELSHFEVLGYRQVLPVQNGI